jgi:hypothetical protein
VRFAPTPRQAYRVAPLRRVARCRGLAMGAQFSVFRLMKPSRKDCSCPTSKLFAWQLLLDGIA